jgi:hypothetical protein
VNQTHEGMRRPANPEGRPTIDLHDELVMLRETFVRRPAGVKLGGLVVLAGVLALLASPEMVRQSHSHMDARHPLKLGLFQPSVSAAAQAPCAPSQQQPEGLPPSP